MSRKAKISGGIAALALLTAILAPPVGQEPAPPPQIRPVSAHSQEDRVISPPEPNPTPVGEETANLNPHSMPLTEIAFESPKSNDSPAIQIPTEPLRDNTTPTPTPSRTSATDTENEPKMGDTRIVGGQKQVYFLGFDWIEDNDTPSIGIIVDGDGDINKMVGTMN